jgi:beta-lactamase regulating signal transducer with metallopeptidase domain
MATTAALEIVLRVSLLFAAAAMVASGLRHRSAATRHLVWAIALAGSLALPVLSYVAPAWEVAVLPASQPPDAPAPASFAGSGGRANVDPARDLAAGRPAGDVPSLSSRRSPDAAASASGVTSRGWTWEQIVFASWMAGFLTVLSRLALGSARMWWLARRARAAGDGSWLRLARRLASAFGVRERVVFLEGGPAAMPMTWGLLKARVLLPDSASNWPVARQRVVLLHELAHVKRRDCLIQLLAQVACAIYWFNPLAWLAARRLRAEREHACDDLVLAAGTRGSDYADHLLEIARSLRGVGLPTWAAVAMAHRSQLEGRLMAILDPDVPRRSPSRAGAAGLVAAAAIVALPIVLVTPVPRAAPAAGLEDVEAARAEVVTHGAAESPRLPAGPAPQPSPRMQVDSKPLADSVREGIRAAIPAVAAVIPDSMLEGVVDGVREGVADAAAEWEQGPPQGGVPGGVPGDVRGGVDSPEDRKHPADPRAVAALLEALKDTDTEVREQAMQALASLRVPEAIGPMRAALKDASPDVREQAAYALGQMRDTGSVDALVSALRDEDASVREQAVYALGQIRDRRAGAPLAGALKDVNASVREQAAYALGQLRDTSAVAALGAALKDEIADVREQAAYALGQIRDEAAVDPLIGALADEDADVREQAAYALGQIGSPRAIDGLTAALKDSNAEVRRQAAYALGQISR